MPPYAPTEGQRKELEDSFGEDDVKLLNGWKANRKKQMDGKKDYKRKLGIARDSFANDVLKKAGLKKGQKDRRLRGLVSDGSRILAKRVEADDMSEGQALLFLPPDSSVSHSRSDNRWRISWGGFRRSRSWALHGEVDSFAIAAKFLWEEYTRLQEVDCPWDFINKVKSD